MLSSEDKIFDQNLRESKRFSAQDSPRNTLKSEKTNIGRLSVCESCEQSVRSNALQEAVSHGHIELQISLPQLKTVKVKL